MAAVVGTAFEQYDMHIYGVAASLVFATTFFPQGNAATATLAAFATFAVGFVARPLGGILFGHVGDRLGRKLALQLSFLIMGGGTFVIGLLPTYAHIGFAAPIVLVALRVLQGVALGGEHGGAWLTLVENAPPHRRGVYGAFAMVGSSAGAIVGSLIYLGVTTIMPSEAFESWGWRLPFILAGLLVPLGLYVRHRLEETPEFLALAGRHERVKLPLVALLRRHWQLIVLTAGVSTAYLTLVYVVMFYSVSFLRQMGASPTFSVVTPLVFLILQGVLVPLAGQLSDVLGRKRVFVTGLVAMLVCAFPFFWMLSSASPIVVVLAAAMAAVPAGLLGGTLGTFMAELFSGNVRYTGISLGFQLGSVFGGGLAPLIATALFTASGEQVWSLGLYFAAAAVLGLLCAVPLSPSPQPVDEPVTGSTGPLVPHAGAPQ